MIVYPKVRAFIELAENLNFTQTAAKLYMSQSTLSKMIATFESECGYQLFYRTNRSVGLTREGQLLYERIKNVDNMLYDAISESGAAKDHGQETLKIACGAFFCMNEHILTLFRKFSTENPQYEIVPKFYTYNALRDGPFTDKNDVYIVMDFDDIYHMERHVLYENRPFFQISRSHPLCQSAKPIKPEQLAECEFVTLYPPLSYGYNSYLEKCCAAYGFRPKIAKYVENIVDQEIYSGYSNYVSLTFEHSHDHSVANKIPIPKAPEANTVLLYRKENSNPALAKFLELL